MAASAAGCEELVYYCFGDTEFAARFEEVIKSCLNKQRCVKDLWTSLRAYKESLRNVKRRRERENRPSLFASLTQ